MHLFYAPGTESDSYVLDEQESRHCIKVLRLTEGDTVYLTNGKGTLYEARLMETNPKACMVRVVNTTQEYGRRDYKLHIGIAPPKNISRFEWFLEKATEIGVDEITPVICEHSERKILKPERLRKIITSAVKQSLKAYHPVLHDPLSFNDLISKEKEGPGYIAYLDEDVKTSLKEKYNPGEDVLILVGPEGDFSPQEINQAGQQGFTPVTLGKSRLRTETAGVVVCHTVALLNE